MHRRLVRRRPSIVNLGLHLTLCSSDLDISINYPILGQRIVATELRMNSPHSRLAAPMMISALSWSFCLYFSAASPWSRILRG
jgi:hypothetical protein